MVDLVYGDHQGPAIVYLIKAIFIPKNLGLPEEALFTGIGIKLIKTIH